MTARITPQTLAVTAAVEQWAPSASVLDLLVADARGHLAGLLLRRLTVRVREVYPQAAALRVDDLTEEGVRLLAVLGADGAPLPQGSRDDVDDGTPAWDDAELDSVDDLIAEDLAWYAGLATPDDPDDWARLPLAGA
ncbi:hypothetical protein FF36_05972 [Frankia torreyi]|uniref:Uncharacterized protein n=1 Tax=Frankia torreyi TaxID=1856 RepID=A0A0D8B8M6_9ACTN|nr:hypothetical protein [Frankia torreyi]KJE19717.1 hypothetical protein FF36_05972 [Frankia torreyi]